MLPKVVPSLVGVLDLLAGDFDLLTDGLAPGHRSDGDNLDADLDLLRLTPDTLSLLLGFRDCLETELFRLMLLSSLTTSESCWSNWKWDILLSNVITDGFKI